MSSQMASSWAKSDECSKCKKSFNLTRRRHHCRKCSQSICSDCSAKDKLLVTGFQGPQLVCADCFKPPESKPTVAPVEIRGNCPICKKPVTTDHERFRRPDTNEYIHFSCQSSVATPAQAQANATPSPTTPSTNTAAPTTTATKTAPNSPATTQTQQTESKIPQSGEESDRDKDERLKEEKAKADALREAEEESEREERREAELKKQMVAARAAEEALRTSQAQLALAARMAEDARRAEEARKGSEPNLGTSFTKPTIMVHLESSTPSGPRPGTPRADSPVPDLTLDRASSHRGSLTNASPPLERAMSRRASFSVTPTKTPDGSRPSTPRPVSPVRSLKEKTPLEVAAATVRSLKASVAPLADVASAIQAYLAIELNSAADQVRVLKAQHAPEAEVLAAIKAYSALELQDAADRVRLLKEQSGEPEELRSAEDVYRTLKREFLPLEAAADYIQELKLRLAPVSEVKLAVEKYLSLECEAAAERVRALEESKASQSQIQAVIQRQKAIEGEMGALCNAALNSIAKRVGDLKRSGTAEAVEAYAHTELEVLAEHIRTLKAQSRPLVEVKAAVEAYSALEDMLKVATVVGGAAAEQQVEEATAPAAAAQTPVEPSTPATTTTTTTTEAEAEQPASQPAEQQAPIEPNIEPKIESTVQHEPETVLQPPQAEQTPVCEDATPTTKGEETQLAKAENEATNEAPPVPVETPAGEAKAAQQPSTKLEELAEDIRSLKARTAPEADVRRAVLALQQAEITEVSQKIQELRSLNSSPEEIGAAEAQLKALEDELKATQQGAPTELEQAASRIRQLKTSGAPMAEVQAAVEAYSVLESAEPSDGPQVTMHLPTSETIAEDKEKTLVFQ